MTEPQTTLEYINIQAKALKQEGLSNIKNEILWYLESQRILTKTALLSPNKKQPSQTIIQAIQNFINQRRGHTPFQYILNKSSFYGRDFIIDKRALIPRQETERLIDVLKKTPPINSALEIGVGSGVISCTLSLEKIAKKIFATDCSRAALSLAQENINKFSITNIQLTEHNIFKDTFNTKFDLIVSNPPYVSLQDYNSLPKHILKFEPRRALTDGKDGLSFYKRYARILRSILKPQGCLYCEIGKKETLTKIKNFFYNQGFCTTTFLDFNNNPRVLKVAELN